MGLQKGTLTFSRYRLIGTLPDQFPAFFSERIRHNAFQNVWRTADEKATGWTGLDDPLDTEFPYASYAQGRYLLFSFRVDRKSVSPALLRLRIMEAVKNKLAETGQKKLYREQKEGIKDGVRLDLLGKTLPVPSFFEVCWSVPENTLLFCSLSDKVFEELQELFRDSFKLALCPYVPWELPQQGAGQTRENSGESASPANAALPTLLPGVDPATIGREFLTWLWFKSEERNGTVLLPDEGAIGIDFIRRLVLESGEGEYAETIVCQGMHTDLKEGKEALRQGKRITAARLRISHNQTEWEFTFKADRFQFQSMKLPTLPDQEGDEADKEGQLLERIYLIDRAVQIMDLLFQSFLSHRLAEGWEEELGRMQKWISVAD